jgi:hypothetical protein
MTKIRETFLNLYLTSDAISIDGALHYDYDAVVNTPNDLTGNVIFLFLDDSNQHFELTNLELDTLSVDAQGIVWSVAGYNIEFSSLLQLTA